VSASTHVAGGWTLAEIFERPRGSVGTSDWLIVDREQLATFAQASRLTADSVDLTTSLNNRWGPDLVDGFLLVSLLVHFQWATFPLREPGGWALNYGLDGVRFIAPVFVGERVRDHIELIDARERRPGQILVTTRHRLEIEGKSKPALIANWLSLYLTGELEPHR